ncbi:hypothetical protein P153DRAFT_290768, partial [Dothidotthia symphoricarpi CBS 119687]
KKRGDSAVTLLTGVDPRNIIPSSSDEEDQPLPGDRLPTPSTQRASHNLRTRKATQSKLSYDQRYHPMDDSLRPSQAAKRRSMHGEDEASSNESSISYPECTDTDVENAPDSESEGEGRPAPARKGKKRTRAEVGSLQATRRSSRKVSNRNFSYSIKVHPQDRDLEISSDESGTTEKVASKRRKHGSGGSDSPTSTWMEPLCEILTAHTDSLLKTSSSPSLVATPPPYGIRRMEGLDVWKRSPGHRYFPHDRNSHLVLPSQPFDIFTERLEDQLEREANASSPLRFDHDDKENLLSNPGHDPTPDPLQGISIIPASQHRQSSENKHASHQIAVANYALYDDPPRTPTYGLGGSDGAHDEIHHTIKSKLTLESLHEHRLSEQLPQVSTHHQDQDQANDYDSVIGMSSSTTTDIDSVVGVFSSVSTSAQ